MISVLIPVHNYSIVNLVKELKEQSKTLETSFEILILDDCSTNVEISKSNLHFCEANNISYFISEYNLGNAKARNYLAKIAQYDWLLFIDADMYPVNKDFLQKYAESIVFDKKIICGEIIYKKEKPKEGILRWKYGKTHEEISFSSRLNNPYLMLRLNCFMIDRGTYKSNPLPELQENYGYTDIMFSLNLKKVGIVPLHIENPMYHLGLETNEKYLKKTKKAIKNIVYVMKGEYLYSNTIKIISFYSTLQGFYGDVFIRFLFRNTKKQVEKNLLSKNPSTFLFQFYKLGYLSELLARE